MQNGIMGAEIKKSLFPTEEGDYGSDYRTHYLEVYRIYVERMDAVSARRESANTFFLSLHTVLIGVMGYVGNSEVFMKMMVGVVGCILSYFWYRLLLSYRSLNAAKCDVILEIEKKLPLSPYGAEWRCLGYKDKNSNKYRPLTHIEVWVPGVFMVLYFCAVVFILRSDLFSIFQGLVLKRPGFEKFLANTSIQSGLL